MYQKESSTLAWSGKLKCILVLLKSMGDHTYNV